ncbi:MAG TPA: aminoacetone oxidase family FAD-binding enzyme [Gemmatimonadales bacterium]|nr:aminoacetone oxidase family FAD-binding enzyme [Gemmatimonadales bacterium]
MSDSPVVVIGAGAAGLMAAIHAAGTGRRVLLLERTRDGGRKILISGGGRCNILPSVAQPERFVTDSPRPLLRHILRGWPLEQQRQFFEEELGLALVLEPETGKLFPEANRARVVRDRLLGEARERGAEIHFGVVVAGLIPPSGSAGWQVLVDGAPPINAARVIVATGGLSVPSTGSDGLGLGWLEALGHALHPTYPALTPLLGVAPAHHNLSGISLPVRITVPGTRPAVESSGGFLFTHRGWSGPAVLDVSHCAVRARIEGRQVRLLVSWDDRQATAWEETLLSAPGSVVGALRGTLPDRLANLLLAEAGVDPRTGTAQLRRENRRQLVELLTRYPLPWQGDEGYKKAEVTGGGVALDEVATHTLESRRHPGLHVCGEALDAFGPIGGHNFQWAWATGRQAGVACR